MLRMATHRKGDLAISLFYTKTKEKPHIQFILEKLLDHFIDKYSSILSENAEIVAKGTIPEELARSFPFFTKTVVEMCSQKKTHLSSTSTSVSTTSSSLSS